MTHRILAVLVSLLLIGMALNGVRTGRVPGRIGMVQRAGNPLGFWFRVVFYAALGVLGLCDAFLRA